MYCIKCGAELSEGESFCIKCGSQINNANTIQEKIEKVQSNEKSVVKETINMTGKSKSNKCKFCGNIMLENEKFCINCGKSTNGQMVKDESNSNSLKQVIQNIFNHNKILSIISKLAIVFALYYPIVLILKNLKLGADLIEILDNIDVIMFYCYYTALISLYANKKYGVLILAILLRIINSIVYLCSVGYNPASIERIVVIIILLYYIFNEFKSTQEYKEIENKYKKVREQLETEMKVKTCANCGAKMSEGSNFCQKCGNKM